MRDISGGLVRLSKEQNLKSKFRSSSAWKKWRKVIYDKDEGKDFITRKKLYKGYNCHHLDLREKNYRNITDPERFISLNKMTHDMIHWAYMYWVKDKSFLDRLRTILEKMEKYSND